MVTSLGEKDGICRAERKSKRHPLILATLIAAALVYYTLVNQQVILPRWGCGVNPTEELKATVCPQERPLIPEKNNHLWSELGDAYTEGDFKTRALNWLGGAVQIPTESFDAMDPVGVDPRWEVFAPFHEYLLGAFPLVHTTLKLTKVNTYGLVYHWQGSDDSLKPALLAAHQDVVPVNPSSVGQWTHPPYSGYFDGERLWGRGSSDDKSGLIGILTAIETLLEKGFEPTRSFVLAFGFDEEASGLNGAYAISRHLTEVYGSDSFAILVDEGSGFSTKYGTPTAAPGVAEKGYVDVRLEVATAGGHSSIPPPHTSIGILSALLVKIEATPHKVHLRRDSTLYAGLVCSATHASKEFPKSLRKAILKSGKSDKALKALEDELFKSRQMKSLVGTTAAVDMVGGGVKANALPELAWGVVNHRVATDSSIGDTFKYDTALLHDLAIEHNLTFTAFGQHIHGPGHKDHHQHSHRHHHNKGSNESSECSCASYPSSGTLTISDAWGTALEPAPVTPTSGDDASPYRVLSGTIKATYNSFRGIELTNSTAIVVAPGMMSGNTDTRYYWGLTKHIFRYGHRGSGGKAGMLPSGVHTVNEYIDADAYLEMIRFFMTLILNVDESSL